MHCMALNQLFIAKPHFMWNQSPISNSNENPCHTLWFMSQLVKKFHIQCSNITALKNQSSMQQHQSIEKSIFNAATSQYWNINLQCSTITALTYQSSMQHLTDCHVKKSSDGVLLEFDGCRPSSGVLFDWHWRSSGVLLTSKFGSWWRMSLFIQISKENYATDNLINIIKQILQK